MKIQVKGINDHLLFVVDEGITEAEILEGISNWIKNPMLSKEGYFIRAYFDFGKRPLSHRFISTLLDILTASQQVIFCGFNQFDQVKTEMVHLSMTIRNGQVVEANEDVVFDGKINPGGYLKVKGNVYALGEVRGVIEVCGENVHISATHLENAILCINEKRLEHVSTRTLMLYDEKSQTGNVLEGDSDG